MPHSVLDGDPGSRGSGTVPDRLSLSDLKYRW